MYVSVHLCLSANFFRVLPLIVPEIPLLDGSASGWVDVIQQAGLQALDDGPPVMLPISEPIVATHPHDPNSAVYAFPSPYPIFSIGIEFLSVRRRSVTSGRPQHTCTKA